MSGSFADHLLDTPGPRVIALQLERGYRDATEQELDVPLARSVRCSQCGPCGIIRPITRLGCPRCEYVGWSIEETTAKVLVPRGATLGTRVTVEGGGDVRFGGAGPIIVEIVQPGPRADELRAAQADFEGKLYTAWQMDRAARGRNRRRWGTLAGAAVVLVVLVVPLARWLEKSGAGERCSTDKDCRSDHCVSLRSGPIWEPEGSARVDALICTASCTTDLDCPESMGCRGPRPAKRSTQFVVDLPDGLSCVPRGY